MSYYWRGNYERAEMDTMIVPPARDGITPAPLLTEYNVFYGCTGYYPDRNDELIINNTRITTEVDVEVGRQGSERVWEFLLKTNLDVQISFSPRNADGKLAYINGTLRTVTKSEPPYQALSDDQVFAELSVVTADYQIEKTAEGYILYQLDKPQLNSKRFVSTNVTTLFTPFHYVVDINNKSCDVRIILAKTMRKEDLVNAGNTNRYEPDTLYRFTDTSLQIDAEMTSWDELVKLPTVRINGNRLTMESTLSKVSSPIGTITAPLYFLSKPNDYVTGRTYFLTAPMPRKLPVTEKQLEATVSDYGLTRTQLSFDELRDRVVNNAVGMLKSFSIKMLVAEEGSYATGGEYTFSLRDLNGEYDAGYINPMDVYTTIGPLDLDVSAFPADIRCTIPSIYMAKNLVSGEIRSRDVYDPNTPTALIQVVNQSARVWNKPSNSNTWTEIHHTHTLLGQNTFVMTRTFTNKFF
ncbi:hypothetical protein SPFM12_00246 [Salmonella phage SPFM12]|nr:hypothetical protein SPFM12_00246 [Salmonella phage SPFM12]